MSDETEPQEMPRRLALIECGEGMKVEVLRIRRRWCFGRIDVFVRPTRGEGGRWVREQNVQYLEPGEEGDDE